MSAIFMVLLIDREKEKNFLLLLDVVSCKKLNIEWIHLYTNARVKECEL